LSLQQETRIVSELATSTAARSALRRFASGVTVLTVNLDGVRHGATVSAVVPISRDPLVLGVCLRSPSGFCEMTRKAGRFCVNVLSTKQAWLANQFAKPNRPPGDAQFHAVQWWADKITGAPFLAGCVAHISCDVLSHHPIGDHDLIVAEAVAGFFNNGTPLITYAGSLMEEEGQS
jgi:flavin reductase (DIM6/NTAB) family NADH-FMN oxidoreductase RutF